MNNNFIIRNETPDDYRAVENLTRESFWNVYKEGADEHYFVHVMRSHEDFIPELAFVIEKDGQIVGNVMYTKAKLIDEKGEEKVILSFGPLCVHPDFQRNHYGRALLEHSFEKAKEMGYDVIAIFGNPANYVGCGFKSSRKYNVCLDGDYFPTPLLVNELKEGALDGRRWYYHESSASEPCGDVEAVEKFDSAFPPKKKEWKPSQEEFYIYSHSSVNG